MIVLPLNTFNRRLVRMPCGNRCCSFHGSLETSSDVARDRREVLKTTKQKLLTKSGEERDCRKNEGLG